MHVVSFDFPSDVTTCGRHIRFFFRLDEYICRALAINPRSVKAADVVPVPVPVPVPEDIIAETGTAPTYVRCENGPEFTAVALIDWCKTAGVETAFIDPRSPWHNGLIESFNAQLRREELSGENMDTVAAATYLAEEWKAVYDQELPHGSLDGKTPNATGKTGPKKPN